MSPSSRLSVRGSSTPSSTRATSLMPDRVAVALRDDEVREFLGLLHPAERPQHFFPRALIDPAAGQFEVLPQQAPGARPRRRVAAAQAVRVGPHIHGPVLPADEDARADAGYGFEVFLDLLRAISVISRSDRLPETVTVTTGAASRLNFSTFGRVGADGQARQERTNLSRISWAAMSPFFSSLNPTTICVKPSLRGAAQFVDARNGVDDFLDRLRDGRFHLVHARALERGRDDDDGHVHVREQFHAQPHVRREPEHDRGEDEHGREHRPADADIPNGH